MNQNEPLTVLSYGAGQDSTAILYRLHYDAKFRARYVRGRLLIVMSDTGDEHPDTDTHVEETKAFCEEHGYEFVHITSDMGFHGKNWESLRDYYRAKNCVGSKAFPKVCTDRLKIVPIYKFLACWVTENYGYQPGGRSRGKAPLVEFAEKHGKITVLVGLAGGEEKRVKKSKSPSKWFRTAINTEYPLIDYGMNRKACQEYIHSVGHKIPVPTNCMLCPFMDLKELLWLARQYPEDFQDWVDLEQAKIDNNRHMGDRNLGVWGTLKLLPEMLAKAEKEHGHLTLAQLAEHRFSHGHCVMSQY